jgi:hypothetical protein
MEQRFNRKRILTRTEANATGYQSQGSYPSGLKNVRSHSLRSTIKHAVTGTNFSLFQGQGETKVFDTNMGQAGTIPNGQSFIVHTISFRLVTPATGFGGSPKVFDADALNCWANWLRETIFTYGRENAQWDAYFQGSEVLPSVFGLVNAPVAEGQSAPVRLGDFVKPEAAFRLKVPVVHGQNSSFFFDGQSRFDLDAANPLKAGAYETIVELKGLLTKMAAV